MTYLALGVAALVLRRIAKGIADVRGVLDEGPATCLEMATRMLRSGVLEEQQPGESPLVPPRGGSLITPP